MKHLLIILSILLFFCSIYFNNLFAQTGLERGGEKIIQSLIEEDSDEKEIINVIKSAANFEIGFEIGVGTSGLWIKEGDKEEAMMVTANKPYFSTKISNSFENLPMYKVRRSATKCTDSDAGSECIPYFWELAFSRNVADRQQLAGDTLWESQKVGTEVIVGTYQFSWNTVPQWLTVRHEDFTYYFIFGLLFQHNTVKGDYYKTEFDEPSSITEEKCNKARTPSEVVIYCEKKTIDKSRFVWGPRFRPHWVIPKYYSNLGFSFDAIDFFSLRFYYGFYYAF